MDISPGKYLVAFGYSLLIKGGLVVFTSLIYLGLFGQQLPELDAVYSIVPKPRIQQMIREAALPVLQKKKVEKEVIAARFAAATSVLADSIAASFRNDAEIIKMIGGDSISVKVLSGGEKVRWENKITAAVDKQIKSDGYLWKTFLARDYSDRILNFHTDVTVQPDGQLKILETITVYNGSGNYSPDIDYSTHTDPNNDIQRGIVRDFPTRYKGKDGFWQTVGFKLNKVLLNGNPSPYNSENLDNGIRILVGESDKWLADGIYTYQFDYITNRQMIYHENKDELYWNVNGNGWVFFADSVSSMVRFPYGSMIIEDACYTGYQGSTERNCYATRVNDSTIHFAAVSRLEPWQGLTVAAAIQKGIIIPEPKRTVWYFLKDNWGLGILGTVLLALFSFYFSVWYAKGRDPKKGTIIPQLEPPEGLSPADVGYIIEQKYGSHLFAASLVDMAVHKYLVIEHENKGFLLKKPAYKFVQPDKLQNNQLGHHLNALYGFKPADLYGKEAVRGEYNPSMKSYYDSLHEKLKDRFRIRKGKNNTWHGLFVLNDGYTGCGGVIAFGALIFGVIYIVTHFTLNILAACVALIVLLFLLQSIFTKIISAYTEKGRQIADHIEGFKMYLETAEQRLYQHFTPPEKNLELFEKYLPYAIALKVENAWASKFDSIVQKAIEGGYQPTYYRSSSGNMDFSSGFRMSAMSSGISSGLSSTVASASTPPSSSGGGSGGGGSSGGGGGGGGGGGW